MSTLKAVFQNKKHLFKGLALENKPHDWKEYPLIHLDFPNREVEAAFEAYLLDEYSGVKKERIEVYAAEMARMLKDKDLSGFMGKLMRRLRRHWNYSKAIMSYPIREGKNS